MLGGLRAFGYMIGYIGHKEAPPERPELPIFRVLMEICLVSRQGLEPRTR